MDYDYDIKDVWKSLQQLEIPGYWDPTICGNPPEWALNKAKEFNTFVSSPLVIAWGYRYVAYFAMIDLRIIEDATNVLFDACDNDIEHSILCHSDTLAERFRQVANGANQALEILQTVPTKKL